MTKDTCKELFELIHSYGGACLTAGEYIGECTYDVANEYLDISSECITEIIEILQNELSD